MSLLIQLCRHSTNSAGINPRKCLHSVPAAIGASGQLESTAWSGLANEDCACHGRTVLVDGRIGLSVIGDGKAMWVIAVYL